MTFRQTYLSLGAGVWQPYAGFYTLGSISGNGHEGHSERLLGVRDTRSSGRYVSRHNMHTKGGNYLGSRRCGRPRGFSLERALRVADCVKDI